MEFTCVPIIVICCYMIGEIYKVLFSDNKKMYKLIPIFMSLGGGLLAVLIYITNKEMIFNVDNIWIALEVGIVSGASSTSANQIIKQMFKKNN